MVDLQQCYEGIEDGRRQALRDRVAPYADVHGRIPEAGDAASEFDFNEPPSSWEEFVAEAARRLDEGYWAWRGATTGPSVRTGFLRTATWECAIGRHQDCPGWGHEGQYSIDLEGLDGVKFPTVAACACRGCDGHREERELRTGGAGRVSDSHSRD